MTYLKRFDEIKLFNDFVIGSPSVIDVYEDVSIANSHLTKIPFVFGKVTGGFYCESNLLTSLKGCPTYVGGSFDCSSVRRHNLSDDHGLLGVKVTANQFKSLEHAPEYVGGFFDCEGTDLISLEGCPKYIGEYLNIQCNNLYNFYGIGEVVGYIFCEDNPVEEIYKLCPTKEFVGYLNEFRPIRGKTILGKRLEECLYMCDVTNIDVLTLKFKNYTLLE